MRHGISARTRSGFALIAVAGLAASASAGPLTPPAGPVAASYKTLAEVEPRTAINLTNTPGDADSVYKITAPGSYYLAGNASVLQGRGFIEIAASDVTVDFGGFRVQGFTGTLDGVFITGNRTNIELKGLNLNGFDGDGVDAGTATGVRVREARVSDCAGVGLRLGVDSLVKDSSVSLSGSHGVIVGERSVIADSEISLSVTGDGVRLNGDGARLERSTLANNAGSGVAVTSGTGAVIADCVVRENSGIGASLTGGCSIDRSVLTANTTIGLSLGNDCRADDCVVANTNGYGVSMHPTAALTDSKVTGNLGHGIFAYFASGDHHGGEMSRNTVARNGDGSGEWAIYISSGVSGMRIADNTVRYNRGGIKVLGHANTIIRNDSSYNLNVPFDIEGQNTETGPLAVDLDTATSPFANVHGVTLIFAQP